MIDMRNLTRLVAAALLLSASGGIAQFEDLEFFEEEVASLHVPVDDIPDVLAPPDARRAQASANVRRAPRRLADYNLPGLETPVKLTSLEPMDVVQLIEFLAYRGGLRNIVIGNAVSGMTAKLKFDNVTVGDALEVVFSVNNLAYQVQGDIITVMTDEEYQRLYGASFYDHKQVRVVDLIYADPQRVSTMLGAVKSSIGTVVADPVTGTLILIDTPEKIDEMLAVVRTADIATVSRVLPTQTRTFTLQYGEMAEVESQVRSLLSREAGVLIADNRTQSLVVTDLPHNITRVESLLEVLDRRPKQVFIEAKIVEITLDEQFSLGINWQHMFAGLDPRFSLKSVSAPGGPATPVGTLTYNTIVAGGDLQAVLTALKNTGDTKLLSNPQVAVLDGQEARIEVVDEQPYKEVTMESGTTNITGVTYLFKKVGVQLSVTPRINDEDMISVAVRPEIGSITQWYDGAPQEGTPVVRQSVAETSIMIRDGVTIIIGGLIQNRKDVSKNTVPVLGAIPLLGRFFSFDSEASVNTETVVFLTPRIISGEAPFLRMRDMEKQPRPLRTVGGNGGRVERPIR